jgi:hypothetical protein
MKVKKLEFRNILGAGDHIFAHIDKDVNCCEFTMNGNKPQPILQVEEKKEYQPVLIGYDMWIQFPPLEWKEMVTKTFKEMVDLWNEKYSMKENE